MEFLSEDQDYSVAEFFKIFQSHLPAVVKVNQGFQGYIIEDTFGKGEVLYIAAISKQKRVVAEVDSGHGRHRMLSIPAAFSENLCIMKRGKYGLESSLSDILEQHRLPVKVQFPPNDIIIMGGKRYSSNQMPAMKLLKIFEETYLLGNLLTDGKLDPNILRVPVYLSQLRLCLVTGIKYLSSQGWESHCSKLEEESRNIEYDLLFGNQYVAEYDNQDLKLETRYEYIEPMKYDSILNLMQHWPESHLESSSSDTNKHHSKDASKIDITKITRIFRKPHDTQRKSLDTGQPSECGTAKTTSSESEIKDRFEEHVSI